MVPNPSRRRVLSVSGTLIGSLSVGQVLTTGSAEIEAANRTTDSDGWPMEQHDPGGTSYAPDAHPPKDGVRIRWKQQIETGLSFAYPTPIVANGLVYGVGEELVCADAASGEIVFHTDRAFSGPPAVADARAYQSPTLAFATQTGAVGLNARGGFSVTGVRVGLTRWQTGRKKGGFSFFNFGPTRTLPVAANGTVFVTSGDGLRAIDASSGRIRWRGKRGVRRPAVHDGTVYIARGYSGGVLGYDIETGEQTFSYAPSRPPRSVTATSESLVVSIRHGLLGIDYEGERLWEYISEDLYRDQGTVAVANGVAYAGFNGNTQNRLVAIDTTNGTELWRSEVALEEDPRFAPLAVADGVVYVFTENNTLAAVDSEDGHVRWRFTPPSDFEVLSPPALAGETLYTLGKGYLYALEEQ